MWTTGIGRPTEYVNVATDIDLTIDEFGTLFQSLVMSILGLDPTIWNAYQAALTGLKTVAITPSNAGTGYQVLDIVNVTSGIGGKYTIDTVDGSGSALTGHISTIGTGYALATGVSTTLGHGSGLKLNITAINPWADATPSNPYYNVRLAWPTEGAPAWKINEDICFLQCIELDDEYNRQRERKFDLANSNQATSCTRVMQVSYIFYGPNSFKNAKTIKDNIFYQTNHDTLVSNNLFLIPSIPAATRSPELFEGQWWERTNMIMKFNELIVSNTTIESITSAEIIVKSSTQQRIIDVNPT